VEKLKTDLKHEFKLLQDQLIAEGFDPAQTHGKKNYEFEDLVEIEDWPRSYKFYHGELPE
jgi:hypothetical protein